MFKVGDKVYSSYRPIGISEKAIGTIVYIPSSDVGILIYYEPKERNQRLVGHDGYLHEYQGNSDNYGHWWVHNESFLTHARPKGFKTFVQKHFKLS